MVPTITICWFKSIPSNGIIKFTHRFGKCYRMVIGEKTMMPGPFELIIILVIVLLLFGGKRLKDIGGDLGNAIKGFKKSLLLSL